MSSPLNMASKLNRLLAKGLPGTQTKNLENPSGCKQYVELYYTTENSTGNQNAWWHIMDSRSRDGLLWRLVSVFGSSKNITANLELEMEDKVKLSFKDVTFWSDWSLGERFNLSETLIRKWGRFNMLIGAVSLTLKLNNQALSQIFTGILMVEPFTKTFLDDSENSGDVVVEDKNGVQVKCHKIFLAGQCAAFRAMFNTEMQEEKGKSVIMSDITENGLRALLSYFYYRDITDALWSSLIAVELLKASDKYRIQNLYKFMKNLVLEMENESFSVTSAVQLLNLD